MAHDTGALVARSPGMVHAPAAPRSYAVRSSGEVAAIPRIYSGTSGWVYKGWRAHLYADTPIKQWLHVASTAFSSLEINGSFYSQISPATYERWRDATPAGFRFALKGHRFVTHYKRLHDCRGSNVRLRDQAVHLGPKLAAAVWGATCSCTSTTTPKGTRCGTRAHSPG
jgi:uncharacterized protein YecE (DUF72 family)